MINSLKQRWMDGKATVNGWLGIPAGFAAEIMVQGGWDSLTIDLQHGIQDYQSMLACLHGMQAKPAVPLVRVPSNEAGIIGKALDAGAYGIICPMVNTAADAEAFVSACRYPPRGTRSNGPARPALYVPPGEYQRTLHKQVLVLPMIETRKAVGNLESILDVEGIDAVYIGPSDLGFSYGFEPKFDRDEPEILAAYDRILKETSKRKIFAGIHCGTPAYAARAIDMGFRMVTLVNDYTLLLNAAKNIVAEMRKAAPRTAV